MRGTNGRISSGRVFFVGALFLFIALSVAAGFVSEGPVGYWTFDEFRGTVAADSSGNGFNGTHIGSPVSVPGMIGGALLFNGGDAVMVPASAGTTTGGDMTIALWFDADSVGEKGQGRFVSKDGSFEVRFSNYKSRIYFDANRWATPGKWRGYLDEDKSLMAGWHYLVITYEYRVGNNPTPVFYLDGGNMMVENFKLLSGDLGPDPGNPIYFGNRAGMDRGFDGSLDDPRIYDRILTSWEVNSLFYCGIGKGCED
ncbi:MAG: hypothetical protein A2827_03455 [Candidatus Spechtbacteria bacterium RIFCSPHIGHO2_01_FULL_43_30]|uniref:LamG-like jellyroll fold domain-containing protein n=1 Tax=Candidatus Spechtbacteria bacterium RIFCSPHIGHO2_01_FULL_43_30 TaxID=1802158 RepID=A0A1G2H8P5_9BACT|nr:MAG: hypothetical protein A2827_03455 [Candidatus Spechtbacteria bacterium RIFCSPHIGHO2_01_FULL_43_30]